MRRTILTMVLAALAMVVSANNIHVSNVVLTGANTTSHYSLIKFDLSWDNSWRVNSGPSNWDAAWVFAKFRIQGQTNWRHATFHYADGSGSGDGHIVPAGATIASSNDNSAGGAYGVFIYHNTTMGQGSVSYPGAELRWDYGVDTVTDADQVEVQVYAIEMVYVPQGSYYVGSGGSEVGAFYTYPDTTQPYLITSENAIPVGAVNGELYHKSTPSGNGEDYGGPVPAAFPKGYQAYYCMKYAITQDQYAAFLNILTSVQAGPHMSDLGPDYANHSARQGINGPGPGSYTTAYPYVPVLGITWEDLAAYLDWAALRPMTELEYEKACRGTVAPVQNEFAWGTDLLVGYDPIHKIGITGSNYTLSGPGTVDEGVATNYSLAGGNTVWGYSFSGAANTNGPLRAGAFAANAGNVGRVTAGATYYGIMEMSGNTPEQTVTVGNADGRTFTGRHGDGKIAADGNPDAGWPTSFSGGIGYRAGLYTDRTANTLMVSDRSTATSLALFSGNGGGRGVRTAP